MDARSAVSKQEAAIFERKRISVIEASTKSGKTEGCIVWLMELAVRGKANVNYWWGRSGLLRGGHRLRYRRPCSASRALVRLTMPDSRPS